MKANAAQGENLSSTQHRLIGIEYKLLRAGGASGLRVSGSQQKLREILGTSSSGGLLGIEGKLARRTGRRCYR